MELEKHKEPELLARERPRWPGWRCDLWLICIQLKDCTGAQWRLNIPPHLPKQSLVNINLSLILKFNLSQFFQHGPSSRCTLPPPPLAKTPAIFSQLPHLISTLARSISISLFPSRGPRRLPLALPAASRLSPQHLGISRLSHKHCFPRTAHIITG